MAWTLSEDEENGVHISVNTILRRAWNIGEYENWADRADKWWTTPRESFDWLPPNQLIWEDPTRVIELALEEHAKSLEADDGKP